MLKKIITIFITSLLVTNSFAQSSGATFASPKTPYTTEYDFNSYGFTYDNQILENYESQTTFSKLREGQHTIGVNYNSRYNGSTGNMLPKEWEQLPKGQSVRMKFLVPPGIKNFSIYFQYASKAVIEGVCTSDGKCMDTANTLGINFPENRTQEDYVYVTLKATNIDLLVMGAGINMSVSNPKIYEDWRNKKFNGGTNYENSTTQGNTPANSATSGSVTGGLTFVTPDKWKPTEVTSNSTPYYQNPELVKKNDQLQYMASMVYQPEKVKEFAVNNNLTNKDVAMALGMQENQVPIYFGQVGLTALKPSDAAIKEFVNKNINNPKAIHEAAKVYDLNSADISKAMGYTQQQVNDYFGQAGLTALKPSDSAIKAYVQQNINNPKAIHEAAKVYDLNSADISKAMGYNQQQVNDYFGQAGLTALKPSDSAIKEFVNKNIKSPKTIYEAAKKYDLNSADISKAMGYTQEQVNTYFKNANLPLLKPSDIAIKTYVQKNLNNPTTVYQAAKSYGLSVEDLAKATNSSRQQVIDYFNKYGLKL